MSRNFRIKATMTSARVLVSLCLCAFAFVLAGVAGGADGTPLRGVVGPGFTISLVDGTGARVTQLAAGAFSLAVDDKSDEHNFHLQGPGGVDVATSVEEIGANTFSLMLVDGKYTFFCDPHPGQMTGSFRVGEEPPPPPPPPVTPPVRLVLTVTGTTVRLTTPAGAAVRTLPAGAAVVTVRDRSALRGARLSGAGVSRSTGVGFVGTVTWRVKLLRGTLVYASDLRKPVLRGGRVAVS